MKFHHTISVFLVLLLVNAYASAQILNSDYASGADVLILENEINIFETIQEGIRLSIAECELYDSCNANVNREELSQIIDTINNRINTLSLRYTDTGEVALEDILVGYVDVRDQYTALLDKISDMPEFEVEDPVVDFEFEDFISSSTSESNEVSDEIMDMFEDADEELVDDF